MISLKKLIIAAAFEPELTPFRHYLSAFPAVSLFEVGIGSVTAAVSTTETLLENLTTVRREEIALIFVGSVGSVNSDVDLLSAVIATKVASIDLALAQGQGYLPESSLRHISTDDTLAKLLQCSFENTHNKILTVGACYSPPSISANNEIARLLEQATQASFENLELFGVASACNRVGVRWASLSAVTNYAGAMAHSEWLANYQEAAVHTAEWLFGSLQRISFGEV